MSELPVTQIDHVADALLDAGCDNEDVRAHYHEQGAVHVRGCFVAGDARACAPASRLVQLPPLAHLKEGGPEGQV
jgi:hypothetical protein